MASRAGSGSVYCVVIWSLGRREEVSFHLVVAPQRLHSQPHYAPPANTEEDDHRQHHLAVRASVVLLAPPQPAGGWQSAQVK